MSIFDSLGDLVEGTANAAEDLIEGISNAVDDLFE